MSTCPSNAIDPSNGAITIRLQRRHVLLQALDLLIEPARHPRRRREQKLRLHRIELGGDRLAREQQIERLGDAAGGGAEDRGHRRGTDRQQDCDGVVLADAFRAKKAFRRFDRAHQALIGESDGMGIERRTQIDDRFRIGIGQRAPRDQIENARTGRERLPHLVVARSFISRRQPLLEHRISPSGRLSLGKCYRSRRNFGRREASLSRMPCAFRNARARTWSQGLPRGDNRDGGCAPAGSPARGAPRHRGFASGDARCS